MYITQCPNCQTRFRLSPEHLAAADGQVRCGRCRHIFNAKDKLEDDPALTPPAAPQPEPPPTVATAAAATSAAAPWNEEPSNEAERLAQAMQQAKSGDWEEPKLADSDTLDTADANTDDFALDLPDFGPLPDFDTLSSVQDGATTDTVQQGPAETSEDTPQAEPAADQPSGENPSFDELLNDATVKQEAADKAAADELVEDERGDLPSFSALDDAPIAADAAPAVTGDIAEDSPLGQSAAAAAAAAAFAATAAHIDDSPAPPRKPAQAASGFRVPVWLWVGGVLIALLMLAAQLVYLFRTDIAAEVPGTRAPLVATCQILGCSVPLPQKPGFLRTEWSEMSFIPDQPQLVQLGATLKNHAPYPVAWPYLELTLKDGEEHPLAKKVFAPQDYLAPEQIKLGQFNSNTEIKMQLQIDIGSLRTQGYSLLWFYP